MKRPQKGKTMSKAVLISIQPKWCNLIANGAKTIEVRKNKPKLEAPFKCYIYCTLSRPSLPHQRLEIHGADGKIRLANGTVIGEFICDYVDMTCGRRLYAMADGRTNGHFRAEEIPEQSFLSIDEIIEYAGGKNKSIYGWHISDLVIYEKPKELAEFKKINRECWYADLGLAKRDCTECQHTGCFLQRPPQSWCYVEETT